MIGFDLECVELAGKLAIEQQGDDDDDNDDQVKDEEVNLEVKNLKKVNDEPEEKEDETSGEENVEKLIDFQSLKLVDKSQSEMIKSKPKIEELD